MDKLPMNDVPMLVSAINFLLRDHEFESLDEICNHFNVNRAALEAKVATQGFERYRELISILPSVVGHTVSYSLPWLTPY